MSAACILWFRSDLRIADNPALAAAVRRGGTILPLFVELSGDDWAPGPASRAWLHHSLRALDRDLKQCGAKLLLRRGNPLRVLQTLVGETGADAVYWNREYCPIAVDRDSRIENALKRDNIDVRAFRSQLLFEPSEVQNKSGNPFRVFTPFYKRVSTYSPPAQALPSPKRIELPDSCPASARLEDFELMPVHPWATTMLEHWQPGTTGAERELETFLDGGVEHYPVARDRPGTVRVSRLSPHLHFGELSPRQVWNRLSRAAEEQDNAKTRQGVESLLRQLVWREFAYHLLFHFPHTLTHPFNKRFEKFPWKKDRRGLRAWRRGRTGYPLVDAGMRELWATGWMHNRTRMVVASFLTKHLLVHWLEGARWFWRTLVDADLANNTFGWQWTAGCGADAAPYFRIFNPVSQGGRFDADGSYVRRWVPELSGLPNRWIQQPWAAPKGELEKAGIRLGTDYPRPIIDHGFARSRALAAYDRVRAR